MISVEQAFETIGKTAKNFGQEYVNLEHAIGRIINEDVFADRDFPPFNRVAMDGIAININNYINGQREFFIEKTHGAGEENVLLNNPSQCIEVMTGAMLPLGTDTVIPYEHLNVHNQNCHIKIEPKIGQNIHKQGADTTKGLLLVEKNTKINAAIIGVLATVGKSKVLVKKQPKVAVISTGNELVAITTYPLPHQIRQSNSPSIMAALSTFGITGESYHLEDDYEKMLLLIRTLKSEFDVLVITGSVSKGKFDFIPSVLKDLGLTTHFHLVKQKPGKPFLFGEFNLGSTVFAFPGNPVSSYMCTYRYLIPWIRTCLAQPLNKNKAILTKEVSFNNDLTYFPIINQEGNLATPVEWQGSGDLVALSKGNAFIELPASKSIFKAGEEYPIWCY